MPPKQAGALLLPFLPEEKKRESRAKSQGQAVKRKISEALNEPTPAQGFVWCPASLCPTPSGAWKAWEHGERQDGKQSNPCPARIAAAAGSGHRSLFPTRADARSRQAVQPAAQRVWGAFGLARGAMGMRGLEGGCRHGLPSQQRRAWPMALWLQGQGWWEGQGAGAWDPGKGQDCRILRTLARNRTTEAGSCGKWQACMTPLGALEAERLGCGTQVCVSYTLPAQPALGLVKGCRGAHACRVLGCGVRGVGSCGYWQRGPRGCDAVGSRGAGCRGAQ